jgi:histidine triad (HIT) family protein
MSDIDKPGCHFCDALRDRKPTEPRAFDDGRFAVLMGRYQPTGPGYALVVPYAHIHDLHALCKVSTGPYSKWLVECLLALQPLSM